MNSMSTSKQARLLSLTELNGVGDKRALKLVDLMGGIDAVFQASPHELSEFHFIDEATYESLQNLEPTIQDYEQRISDAESENVELLTPLDKFYPDRLRKCHTPIQLFVRGNQELLQMECVSFAGSRDANDAAIQWTKRIATEVADRNYCVVSGGAFGVDRAAHEAAIDVDGDTIIVSPSGHNNPYPGANSDLFKKVEQRGLIVSHRFPDQEPARGGFIYRNKTNSALGSRVVIAAAEIDSGSMSQYEVATDQNRPVYVPNESTNARPYNGLSKMVAEGSASLIEKTEEMFADSSSNLGQRRLDDW